MSKIDVLISLHKGYGLGDAAQMSAVLRHVVAARPHWRITYQAEDGKQVVGRGIVDYIIKYGDTYPVPYYDAEVLICLYDTWANWGDRPNTRVSSCLHERFGLEWKPEFAKYQVNVTPEVRQWAVYTVPRKAVAVHFYGDSSKDKKDLTKQQADSICDYIRSLDHTPYILGRHITRGHDAEVNCAIIEQCKAFVGIDSGPSKCASATDTPALVTWTGHHPAPFHDPAANTTHLVPRDYHGLEPVCNDISVIKWFEENYNVRTYDTDPVEQIKKWLLEVLE